MNTIYLKSEFKPFATDNKVIKYIFRVNDSGWYQIYPKPHSILAGFRPWNIVCNRADCIDKGPGWDVLTEKEAFLEIL